MPNRGTSVFQNLKDKVVRSWVVNKEQAGPIPAREEVSFSLLSGWRLLWMPPFSRCWALHTTSQSHRFSGEWVIPTQWMGLSTTWSRGFEKDTACPPDCSYESVHIYERLQPAGQISDASLNTGVLSLSLLSFISSWKNNANTHTSSAIFLQHGTLIMLARLVFQIHKQISSKALTTILILLWQGLNTL